MVDKLASVGSPSFGNPQGVRTAPLIIYSTQKELLGLKPDASREELDKVARGKATKGLFLYGIEKPDESKESITRELLAANKAVKDLVDKYSFNPFLAVNEREIIQTVETLYKKALGLSEEATRDEVKQAISSFLDEVQ